MSDYLEVVQFKQTPGGKWMPVRLGSAKKNDKGQLNVYLDALPLPDSEGNCRFVIQQRQPRDDQSGGGYSQQHSAPQPGGFDDGDTIPFAPEWRV